MAASDFHESFVLRYTALATPPLVPEIPLHLADTVTELWNATEDELDTSGLPPPFWAFCWPGGQVVARHILDHPQLVRGRTVLDFAAGSGVAAIACMKAGAARVMATEIDEFAVAALRLNATLNEVDFEISLRDVVDDDTRWDVVIAGDVCYERALSERVERWLRRLAARGALVLMADPGRPYMPRERIQALATYFVPRTTEELEEIDLRDTTLYRVLP